MFTTFINTQFLLIFSSSSPFEEPKKMRVQKMVSTVLGLSLLLCVAHAKEFADTIKLDTGGLRRANFPSGFLFGTASSAYQVEGMADKAGRGPSIWDVFAKLPGNSTFLHDFISKIW